jgi:hypothetical protein
MALAWLHASAPTVRSVAQPDRPAPAAMSPPASPAATSPPADFTITSVPPQPASAPESAEPEHLSPAEATELMALMVERGDPRQPALLPSQPRQRADATVMADPSLYAAFEAAQTRELIQVYTAGVQQIPAIRERIEQAARNGERSAAELDEARAALEQLEMLQSTLQRNAPELLP